MKVELLEHTPDPEKLVATAAKLCYSSSGIGDIREGLTEEKTASFIDMLLSIGHESIMEHAYFTFGVEGISRACSHQLVRHRIASYSQKSQRYVCEKNFDFIVPPSIAEEPEAAAIFNETVAYIGEAYERVADIIAEKQTAKLVAEGTDEKTAAFKAKKIAYEDARFLLPNACETKIVVTMNVRSLFNFFRHRCCNRAQWEIRAVANEMLRLCLDVAPSIFAKAGPACVSEGKCPEGKMTCGKFSEVKAYFDDMKKKNSSAEEKDA